MKLVLGADSSTQSVKVEARAADTGELIATGRASHPATTPPVSEQDPLAWWEAFSDAVSQLGDARKDVVAVSIAGQQHGLVLLCLLYTSPSPRDLSTSRMPSSA